MSDDTSATPLSTSPSTAPLAVTTPELEQRLARLRWLVRVMDDAIAVPGTRLRVGLDPVLGLLPGAGDAAGAVVSVVVLAGAARLGAPVRLLVAMAGNVALEAVVGAVPVVGDVFDVTFRANRRNLTLLEAHLQKTRAPTFASPWGVTAVVVATALLLFGVVLATISLAAYALGKHVF